MQIIHSYKILIAVLATATSAIAGPLERAKQKYDGEIVQLSRLTTEALDALALAESDATRLEAIQGARVTFVREGVVPNELDGKLRQAWEIACERMERAYWVEIAQLPQASQETIDKLRLEQMSFREAVKGRGLAIWTYLFDGRSTEGWTQGQNRGTWSVDKGILCATGDRNKGGGNTIWTTRSDYRNFHLRVRAKVLTGFTAYLAGRYSPRQFDDGPGYRVYISGPSVNAEFPQKLGELWSRNKEIREGITKSRPKNGLVQVELVVDGNKV